MEWTAPETITVGTIIFGVLMLLNRFIGQRTDPKLLEVFHRAMDGFSDVRSTMLQNTEKTNQAYSLLAENVRVSNQASMALVNRVELSEKNAIDSYERVISVFSTFSESVFGQHKIHLEATQGIVPQLETKLTELENQQRKTEQSNQGLKDVMDNATTTQNQILREIQAAVARIELGLEKWERDSSEQIEKIEQDLAVVKADIAKVHAAPEPAPANQPIVKPKPEPETITGKDNPNV